MGNAGRIWNLVAGASGSAASRFLDELEQSKAGQAALAEVAKLGNSSPSDASEAALTNVRRQLSGISPTEPSATKARLDLEALARRQLADLRAGRSTLTVPSGTLQESTTKSLPAASNAPTPQTEAEHPILAQIRERIDSGQEDKTNEAISHLIRMASQGSEADEIALLRCVEIYARFFNPDHLNALRSAPATDRSFINRVLRSLGTANPELSIRARTL